MVQQHDGPFRSGRSRTSADALARGLGWFSIGLGLAEVLAPRALSRAIGLNGQDQIVRAYGVREIATGAAILAVEDPTPWIWGRVAGDALDLATLAAGLQDGSREKARASVALGAVAAATALDVVCARALGEQSRQPIRDYSDRRGFPASPD